MRATPSQPTAFALFNKLFHTLTVRRGIKRARPVSSTLTDGFSTSESLSQHTAQQHTLEQQYRSSEKKQENDDINEALIVLAALDQWVRIQQHTFFSQVFIDQLISVYPALSTKLSSIQPSNPHQDHTAMIKAYATETLEWIKKLASLDMTEEEKLAILLLTAHFNEKEMQNALGKYLAPRGVEKTLDFLLMLSIDHLSVGKKTQYLDTLTNLLVTQPHLISSGDTHVVDDIDTQNYKNKTIKAALDKALYQRLLQPGSTEKKPLSLENLKLCLESFQDTGLNLTVKQLSDNRFTVTKGNTILRTYLIKDDHGPPILCESKKGKTYPLNPELSERKSQLLLYQLALYKLTDSLKHTPDTSHITNNQRSMQTHPHGTPISSPTNTAASPSLPSTAEDDTLKAPQRSHWRKAGLALITLKALQENTQRGLKRQQTLHSLEEASERVQREIHGLYQSPLHQNRHTT